MHTHSHTFGQDIPRAGERRTLIVVIITAVMMIVEVTAGILFGSMALLADGMHMASHALALTLSWAAYVFARKFADDPRFSFGTGKINSLAAYSSALLLAVFAIMMAWESVHRILNPVEIQFNQAIFVAVIGLLVNGGSALILGHTHDHDHHDHGHGHDHDHSHHHEDQNLRSAYLHVLADALTSVTAISALLAAKYFGWIWMDPVMGIVGSILVSSWAIRLLRESGTVLLDKQAPESVVDHIKQHIEQEPGTKVTDLHVWSIGPGIYACELSVTSVSGTSAAHYRSLLPDHVGIVHATIEVHPAA
ncbi:MAG: CDF family Co(II)/Ni(II) efflux transporter DmeF [Calditrichaeota bacterium]|nr:CDF family Co(II)/Ni(II) efflux transporter DmeF [Calditrichota bacterium]MCB9367225.1 CDF family Co(II)/Ni(II) efflux transporter DmeF [Calditrichota bacterium]MCB9391786.1 CDF family Co(II)/Ni(II) efflux transporter DmeF [Calditrichota bacterium]